MRLIDADVLKKVIAEVYKAYDGYDPYDLGRFAERVDELIEDCPTIEARPQGKWIDYTGLFLECDQCQFKTVFGGRFCPNCGADMRGGEDHE